MSLTRHVRIRVSEEDYRNVKAIADSEEVTVSRLIRQFIRDALVYSEPSEWED